MIGKLIRSLFCTCAVFFVGASLCMGLQSKPPADNGNTIYQNGQSVGCLSVSPPYNCYWQQD